MKSRHRPNPLLELLGRIFFPRLDRALRRREVRFLFLSLGLGLMFCLFLLGMIMVLVQQGRI
jgi:hypothetical protein